LEVKPADKQTEESEKGTTRMPTPCKVAMGTAQLEAIAML
jgi:hypothetical protein